MNRRSFIIGAAIATLMTATSSYAQEVTLRLHQFLPQKASIPGVAIEPWIAKIEKEDITAEEQAEKKEDPKK